MQPHRARSYVGPEIEALDDPPAVLLVGLGLRRQVLCFEPAGFGDVPEVLGGLEAAGDDFAVGDDFLVEGVEDGEAGVGRGLVGE